MKSNNYSKQQIAFISDLKGRGYKNDKILSAYNSEKGWEEITFHALGHLLRRHVLPHLALKGSEVKTSAQVQKNALKDTLTENFKKWVKTKGFIPTLATLAKYSKVTVASIKKAVGSIEQLEAILDKDSPQLSGGIIDESSFTQEKFSELRREVSKFKRFFITTAVTGCKPHEKALASIETFCKKRDAKLLVLPVSDPANQKPRKYKFSLSSNLPSEGVVFRDLRLNSNLFLSTIKLQAKQINPLTGLRALGQTSSCILASPKQFLEPISISNKKSIPHHLVTTGAITVREYETKKYVSERTAYLANSSHVLGGVVVELLDDKTFFYRHVQFDEKTGGFCDLDTQYLPDGRTKRVRAELVQSGDWHVGSTCPVFRKITRDIVRLMKPRYLTLEDFFDGITINPHERKNIILRSKRTRAPREELGDLEQELSACSTELSEITEWDAGEVIIKHGNHDDFLNRWLSSGEYVLDPPNHYMGVCLAKAYLENNSPLEFALRKLLPFSNQEKVRFLGVNDSFMVNGVENAVHGHLGAGGKRSPGLKGLLCYGPVNSGHTHAPGIFGDSWRVGTSTILQLSYNDGASAWSNTLLIQHYDGSRQLITAVDGKWRVK